MSTAGSKRKRDVAKNKAKEAETFDEEEIIQDKNEELRDKKKQRPARRVAKRTGKGKGKGNEAEEGKVSGKGKGKGKASAKAKEAEEEDEDEAKEGAEEKIASGKGKGFRKGKGKRKGDEAEEEEEEEGEGEGDGEADGDENPLTKETWFKDKTIVLTGALEQFKRNDLTTKLRLLGAKISSGVSRNTDVLVAGNKPGSKLTKARMYKVKVWRESDLAKALAEADATQVWAAAEAAGIPASGPTGAKVLLARKWKTTADPTGWWVSEKLDGVRAYWDGKIFISRLGNKFEVPDWFTEGLPDWPLDGELFHGRGQFQIAVGVVRTKDKGERWRNIRYKVFDGPGMNDKTFEDRIESLREYFAKNKTPYAKLVRQTKCENAAHLNTLLQTVESKGGEGLMLRQPGSLYIPSRSSTLLKVKTFLDAEARVIGHTKLAPAGNDDGTKMKVGTLRCRMANGTEFSVGSGLSEAQRENPPAIGSIITYRFQELTNDGIPRFPVFVGERPDMTKPKDYDEYADDDEDEDDEELRELRDGDDEVSTSGVISEGPKNEKGRPLRRAVVASAKKKAAKKKEEEDDEGDEEEEEEEEEDDGGNDDDEEYNNEDEEDDDEPEEEEEDDDDDGEFEVGKRSSKRGGKGKAKQTTKAKATATPTRRSARQTKGKRKDD